MNTPSSARPAGGDRYLVGVDVGTGSARAGLFDLSGRMLASGKRDISLFREPGAMVEQSSTEIWAAVCASVREAVEKAQDLEAQRATVASLEATIAQSAQRMAQVKSSYASNLNQARLETITEITRLEQQHHKFTFQQGLLELRAPQAGVVTELATTTVGAVVQPGTVLLSLVLAVGIWAAAILQRAAA